MRREPLMIRRKSMMREVALAVFGCLAIGLFLLWTGSGVEHSPVSHMTPRKQGGNGRVSADGWRRKIVFASS